MTVVSPHNDPVLALHHVSVVYSKKMGMFRKEPFHALRDVSFELYHGESLGIVGRNGAGKSTLLRVLAGIIEPDTGALVNNGYKAALLSLQVGFDPFLNGRYNAILSGLLLGFRKKDIVDRMDDIIDFAELHDFIDQPVRTYSSGMRARLGFAVAFQLDPDVLLIDEVLGVGDAKFKEKSSAVMKEKIRSDKTVVLVSHSASTIKELCQRVVWIEHGEMRAAGPPEEVLKAYQDYLKIERI